MGTHPIIVSSKTFGQTVIQRDTLSDGMKWILLGMAVLIAGLITLSYQPVGHQYGVQAVNGEESGNPGGARPLTIP